jgi:sulfatase maturation enzyme AslB (radical SAM superfamily)
MPNKKIFCNVPWTNTHIYWDGSYGVCCSEQHPPHQTPTQYNIKNMSVGSWYNSTPMQQFRKNIQSATPIPACQGCYHEEEHGYESRRIKENFKSVIFTEQAFDRSYQQSPYYSEFERSDYSTSKLPIDWHVDLGNECNLACKMCEPSASSSISNQYMKWQLIDESANRNWTQDAESWNNFTASILAVPNLNRLHFMGGEPLLNKKFTELLDFLIDNKKTGISISFVSNGTMINSDLIEKLKQFRTFDIEISIESIKNNNDYIRQGSHVQDTMKNIMWLKEQQSEQFHLVMRSVPQLLNVNNYDQYIQWAWENQLPVQGIPLIDPDYLQISVLPIALRTKIKKQYVNLVKFFEQQKPAMATLITGRNVSGLAQQLLRECQSVISMLDAPEPDNVDELRSKLVMWLMRWDRVYKLNAFDYYPEYQEFLHEIQYTV